MYSLRVCNKHVDTFDTNCALRVNDYEFKQAAGFDKAMFVFMDNMMHSRPHCINVVHAARRKPL